MNIRNILHEYKSNNEAPLSVSGPGIRGECVHVHPPTLARQAPYLAETANLNTSWGRHKL